MSEGFNFVRKIARPRTDEIIAELDDSLPMDSPYKEPVKAKKVKAAAVLLTFEPGTAIYQLVSDRLDVLEETIKNATKEYEELAKYIKGEE